MKNLPHYETMTIDQLERELAKLPLQGFDRLKLIIETSIKLTRLRPEEVSYTALAISCAYAALRDAGKLP